MNASLPKSAAPAARPEISKQQLEIACVVITFIAMVAGFLSAYDSALSTLTSICYVVAYVAGGIFGLKASIDALRAGAIEVDLLMILAGRSSRRFALRRRHAALSIFAVKRAAELCHRAHARCHYRADETAPDQRTDPPWQ
jgi:hypothetical protein